MSGSSLALDYAVYGSGRPLVLLLGFGMGHEDAYELGYLAPLIGRYQVICVSARGHGASPAPLAADAYALADIVADIDALLARLSVHDALVWGYSLGAKFALGLAAWHPERVGGLVLGGFERHSRVDVEKDLVLETLRAGGQPWCALWQRLMPVPPGMASRLQGCNREALRALRLAEGTWPDLGELLAQVKVPVRMYAAADCFALADMQELAASRGDTCTVLSECDHFSLLAQPERVVRRLAL